MFADLHLHSSCSDGRLAPAELVDAVANAGIGIMALTDHDTTAGLGAAAQRAAQRDVIFVAGIETTTYADSQVVHMIGLGFNSADVALQRMNAIANGVWARNQQRWVAALEADGHDLAYERDFFDGPVRLPVLIERLCRKGVADGDPVRCLAFFRDFFSALRPEAYAELPHPRDAAQIIARAGGTSILAHPYSIKPDGRIREILEQCDGLEARYAAYDPAQRESLERLCDDAGKLYSCGSDYHGHFSREYENPRFLLPEPLALRLTKR